MGMRIVESGSVCVCVCLESVHQYVCVSAVKPVYQCMCVCP